MPDMKNADTGLVIRSLRLADHEENPVNGATPAIE